jgi:SOS-response transcriptional repressor LexA
MNEKQTTSMPVPPKIATQTPVQEPVELTVRPTKKQKELLAYIEAFIAEHGYSPSYREIMNGLQYTSVATVALHVGNLIKRGHLRKRDHSARSLEVVVPSLAPSPAEAPIKINAVREGEEKWLVAKVEQFMHDAETNPALSQDHIDNLYVLLGALRVLGLSGAAQSFMERMTALKAKMAATTVVSV